MNSPGAFGRAIFRVKLQMVYRETMIARATA
jgi:hypothetical protein